MLTAILEFVRTYSFLPLACAIGGVFFTRPVIVRCAVATYLALTGALGIFGGLYFLGSGNVIFTALYLGFWSLYLVASVSIFARIAKARIPTIGLLIVGGIFGLVSQRWEFLVEPWTWNFTALVLLRVAEPFIMTTLMFWPHLARELESKK
jgi:hypothetical protein